MSKDLLYKQTKIKDILEKNLAWRGIYENQLKAEPDASGVRVLLDIVNKRILALNQLLENKEQK